MRPNTTPYLNPNGPWRSARTCSVALGCGRIAIANSDAGGGAYTDTAIDQAHRAVQELLQDAAS